MISEVQRGCDRFPQMMEVVSDDAQSQARDLKTKRRNYAEAGIPEYWIIEPRERKVVVLTPVGGEYTVQGEFGEKEMASSALLASVSIAVDGILRAAEHGD